MVTKEFVASKHKSQDPECFIYSIKPHKNHKFFLPTRVRPTFTRPNLNCFQVIQVSSPFHYKTQCT